MEIAFQGRQGRVTWRDVRHIRDEMMRFAGTGMRPSVMVIGRDVRISLWSRLVCRLCYGVKIRRPS